ncbi:MAG: zf-HC2 domain-containing protein [Actinomycetota bacterium]
MNDPLSCDECRELAPELALGVLDGAERARAVAHTMTCAPCRAYVDQLATTADSILLAGPEAEPPFGFEARTVALLRPAAQARRPRWRQLVAVAAAVLALLAAGVAGRTSASREPLRSANLVSANGTNVGRVFLYGDKTGSWCFVSLATQAAQGQYDVQARLRDGNTVVIQRFWVKDGKGSYGSAMAIRAQDIVEMRVVSIVGSWGFTADLST